MTAPDIDDQDARARLDPSGMLGITSRFPAMWTEGFDAGSAAAPAAKKHLRGVVVAGMGGSGVAGDVAKALLEPTAPVPVVVSKDYSVPRWLDRKALVVAVSYSGQTEETLSAVAQAKAAKARIAVVSSGGKLSELADRYGWPTVRVPNGMAPRAAFPWLAGSVLGLLTRVARWSPPAGVQAALEGLGAAWSPASPSTSNEAKRTAMSLADHDPVAYGWGPSAVAAARFKAQWNENAKGPARNEPMPEANHNDLVAWAAQVGEAADPILAFRSALEPMPVKRRFDFVRDVAEKRGITWLEHRSDAGHPLGCLLENVWFGDYVSVYAALVRGVDPTPVSIIQELKAFLADDAGRSVDV